MSQRIFYEIDGRVHGPINLTQLQLMAASGMLLPHHRVKREGTEQWFAAQMVRGLFSDSTPTPTPVPVGSVLPKPIAGGVAAPAAVDEDTPFGGFGAVESEAAEGPNAAFDFFSDEPVAAPPPKSPKPAKNAKASAKHAKPAPASKTPEPQPFELLDTGAPGTVADSKIQPIANPFDTGSATPMELPLAEAIDEAPAAPNAPEPKAARAKPGESKSETKQSGKTDVMGTPPPVTVAAEVVGRAVDILPDDSLHLLDGKTNFRLHRSWIHAVSKFADGSTRSIYLRLQQIDAAILDQRPTTSRGRSAPNSLLAFVAGNVRIGLVFQDSDKLYRTFLERVLLLGNVTGSSPKPTGKA